MLAIGVLVAVMVAIGAAAAPRATAGPAAPVKVLGTLVEPVGSADLSISQQAIGVSAVAGSTVQWSVTIGNLGPSSAQDVAVTNHAPAGVINLVLTSTVGSCSGDVCDLGNLADGDGPAMFVSGTVDPAYPGGVVLNTASVTATTPDPDPANNTTTPDPDPANNTTAPASLTITRSADVSIAQTVPPGPLAPGAGVTITLTVSNAGPSTAQSLTILDRLPAELTGVTASADAGGCSSAAGPTLLCTDLALDPGQTLVVTILATAGPEVAGGGLSNFAVASATTTDPDLSNNGATAGPSGSPADLTVTKSGSTELQPGGPTAGWIIQVHNNGPGTAGDVAVQDTLPSGLTFSSADVEEATGTCSGADPVVLCLVDNIPAGGDALVRVEATVDETAAGTMTNVATAATADESAPQDNISQLQARVFPSSDISVVTTLSGPPIVAGGSVSWKIVVSNAGPTDASDITLGDTLPAGLGEPVVPATCNLNYAFSPIMQCSVVDLPVGAASTLEVTAPVLPTTRGSLTNRAGAKSLPSLEPDFSNNVSSVTSPVGVSAPLSVTKTADRRQSPLEDPVGYTVTVASPGPSAALDVSVAEELPPGARVSESGPSQGSFDPATAVWSVGTLLPGSPALLTLWVAYSEAGDTLNTVDATSAEQPDGVTAGAAVTVLSGIVGSGQDEAGTESGSAPPTTAAGQQALTDTGLRADQLVVSGLGLLAVGVLLVMAGRPRRDRSTVPGPGA